MSKKIIQYCKTCILPNTRPNLVIGPDGICNACKTHSQKISIDWKKRYVELKKMVAEAKSVGSGYDCIIPVSGGKDSTWQVIKCLEMGMRILAITWRTPARTELGQRNLENLISLGVDHIDYSISPIVESKFMKISFLETGSTAVPMHLSIFSIPLMMAVKLHIPLVIWGESPHMEYGGTDDDVSNDRLNRSWMQRHGILQGKLGEDWVSDQLSKEDLYPYMLPDEAEMLSKNIRSIFLGYYLPWDTEEALKVSQSRGFQVRQEGPKVGYYNYADIDCDFISVHHYFKWLKFGFTRLFDNLSLEIRNGRITRGEALNILRDMGTQRPEKDIIKICKFMDLPMERYFDVEERFRNQDIWYRDQGTWKIKNFILKDWNWDK